MYTFLVWKKIKGPIVQRHLSRSSHVFLERLYGTTPISHSNICLGLIPPTTWVCYLKVAALTTLKQQIVCVNLSRKVCGIKEE